MFRDRKDAALQLAEALDKYKGQDTLVLGIPRGGAETGYYVARHLGAAFSLLISRKLGHPANPEYAVGALAEDGSIYLNETAINRVTEEEFERLVAQQEKEIEIRKQKLRKGKPLPDIRNKTVILVDDGIATGSTLFAAISMCKKQGAAKIVVAAPVSGKEMESKLFQVVDDVVILFVPQKYHSVSQAYINFYNLSDEEALDFWSKFNE